ncbi:MAG: hypothetical protein PXY39_00130 [archaeon]|nr:hypothetical protein [archaeon]
MTKDSRIGISNSALKKKVSITQSTRDLDLARQTLIEKSFPIEGKEGYTVIPTADFQDCSRILDTCIDSLNQTLHNKVKMIRKQSRARNLSEVLRGTDEMLAASQAKIQEYMSTQKPVLKCDKCGLFIDDAYYWRTQENKIVCFDCEEESEDETGYSLVEVDKS